MSFVVVVSGGGNRCSHGAWETCRQSLQELGARGSYIFKGRQKARDFLEILGNRVRGVPVCFLGRGERRNAVK
jgi:hypothetical protein